MCRGQGAGIFLGLALGIEHQHVPGSDGAAFAAILRLVLAGKQIVLPGNLLGAAFPTALLGFEDEGTFAVEIDAPSTVAVVAMVGYRAFENIIISFVGRVGGVRLRQIERGA